MINQYVVSAIFLAALVTWLPRILPYILVNFIKLPNKVRIFFTYLPVSIIFALILSGLFDKIEGHLPSLKVGETLALLPTFWIMLKTKNVMWTVLVGIVSMALLRLLLG